MARKIKNLSVKTREYKDRDGNSKANYQNVGAIMENDNGKQFMLIDKFINFAGLPDFSGKENNASLLVNIFDVDNEYKPKNYRADNIPPSNKGNDNLDDWNSSPQVPEVEEIPF